MDMATSTRYRGTGPEARLLLASAGVMPAERRAKIVHSILDETIDWNYLVDAAGFSACTPHLYRALNEAADPRIPEATLLNLQSFCRHNTIKNLMLIRELVRLMNLLKEHGIEAITYKGPTLATLYYGDPGMRMFWDLDLLVHREDVIRARDLFVAQDYIPEVELRGEKELAYLERDCEFNFDQRKGKTHVEVHWDILPRHSSFNFDSKGLWTNAQTVSLGGAELKTLSPEDLLLVLCIHAGDKHQWLRLRMIQDVAHVVAKADLDWNHFLERIARLQRKRTVLLGLFLAHSLLHAPVPERVIAMASTDRMILDAAALVRGRLFRDAHGLPGFGEWRHYRSAMSSTPEDATLSMPQFLGRYLFSVIQPEFHDRELLDGRSRRLAPLHYFARLRRLVFARKTDLLRRLR